MIKRFIGRYLRPLINTRHFRSNQHKLLRISTSLHQQILDFRQRILYPTSVPPFTLNTSTWDGSCKVPRPFKANLFKFPLFNSGKQFKLATTGFPSILMIPPRLAWNSSNGKRSNPWRKNDVENIYIYMEDRIFESHEEIFRERKKERK